jgi:serine/threonine protein kinase
MLADFGSTRITTIPVEFSSEVQGTASFMAPELLLQTKFGLDTGVSSKKADVYALGMTTYQILTGKQPFLLRREARVILAVISGERPPKPENAEKIGITEVMWDLLRECWKEDRAARPNISDILGRFCDITGERKTTDSTIEVAGPQLEATGARDPIQVRILDRDKKGYAEPESPTDTNINFPPWNDFKRMVRWRRRQLSHFFSGGTPIR